MFTVLNSEFSAYLWLRASRWLSKWWRLSWQLEANSAKSANSEHLQSLRARRIGRDDYVIFLHAPRAGFIAETMKSAYSA